MPQHSAFDRPMILTIPGKTLMAWQRGSSVRCPCLLAGGSEWAVLHAALARTVRQWAVIHCAPSAYPFLGCCYPTPWSNNLPAAALHNPTSSAAMPAATI
mmetsp:Transcript_72421/g.127675  ORF Transcript_72421/g.127675 Transcript_72421/m.127675 type:complete len:100 (-) Transcript_72421:703-1002(-)